jgi:alcohol dehydrogenase (cytochrome c)
VKDLVIVGSSGGDSGVRGFIAGYDAATGKEKWRFWTIPAPGEFGSSSWPGDSYLHGGGTTWMPGTYDPELNTLYWTTSNAAPDFVGDTRPGDDLYTACVLALDPDTGKLKWYFQFTPHDVYDYDANETPVLIDANEDGTMRHLLLQANRNGFFYVLDRTTGKFLRATPFVKKLNWANGIDASGRPILSGRIPTANGTLICPGIDGATNWFSPSYNVETGLLYVIALESCNQYFAAPREFVRGETYYNTGTKLPPGDHPQKILLALSAKDGKAVWSYPQVGQGNSWGGTLTTAGGLVFFGDDSDSLEAVDAVTGRPLWHFNTGQRFRASPMTYDVDGVQYVVIAAESDIFTFALAKR